MSDAITSSYASYGTNAQTNQGSARTLYQFGMATSGATSGATFGASRGASQVERNMAPLLPVQPLEETPLVPDKSAAEHAIRRLTKEMEHAKHELRELEGTLRQELFSPSVRGWLLPLMAIGLLLSFYGSVTSSNSAELGATGLMLLWSLSAFWYIYTRERRREMAQEANRAEIEIWSGRIEELKQSLEHNQRIVAAIEE